ncbi:ABC transporter permease/M1 family aminopeptidase [Telluribacter humicola]|uniref:ABC transporter permease/M1 family aminopeptidase n=1 Tax=Telluribacter humicola TaxID=1720261 RepID=UPI001A979178|nr:M1 family aminopeptidase [Telluribacter humicola]
MRLWETFRYELAYQSRAASTWFYFLLLLVLSYLMAAVVFIDEPLSGSYFLNAPFIVALVSTLTFFFLGVLVLAQIAGRAATRDLESRMHSLLYTTAIPNYIYLGGRFLAAFALGSILMLAIPAGVFVAALFPLKHPELVGPLSAATYISTYFLLILPNAFFALAFMFALAVLSKKGILTYLVGVIFGVVTITSWQIIGVQEGNWQLATLTDPLVLSKITELKKVWTANEKNTLLPGTHTDIFTNRFLWFALSFGVLLVTYLNFRTGTISERKSKKKQNLSVPSTPVSFQLPQTVSIPQVQKSFAFPTRFLQAMTVGKESIKLITLGWGWVAMACMFAFVLFTGPMWFSGYYDIPEVPVTGKLLDTLENVMDHGIWLFIPLLIIFYAGELVWRDRDSRLNEIMGAAPVPVWVSFAGKLGGMVLTLVIMQLLLMVAGMLVQISLGYYNFQIPVYLKVLLGIRLTDYVLSAVLAFAVHVVLNQKYLAHLVSVMIYLFSLFGPEFGIESRLLLYGSDPGWSYSDLRGLDPFMEPWLYFKSYWGAWALLLAVATVVLWPRGTEQRLQKRFQQGINTNRFPIKAISVFSVLLIVILGWVIFYNTHVLYPKTGFIETLEWKAEYEKKYGKYQNSQQPSVIKTKLLVEIFPKEKAVDFKGTYLVENRTGSEIDTVFLTTAPGVTNILVSFNKPVKAEIVDEPLAFQMYVLEKPLFPGDSVQLEFHVRYNPQGFPNSGINTSVAKNGTYFDDSWLPVIGYLNSRQVFNANDRKAQGLEPKSFLESEVETFAQQRVAFETIIGTDKGQTAVVPGNLVKSWTKKDRTYFHYTSEIPINNKLAFFSSEYRVHNAQWKADSAHVVAISILHHPDHTHNLERMVQGVQASFNYLSGELGKYPHSEIRFTEVPGYNKGMHAYPTNIFYREGYALLKPEEDPGGIDIVFATVAHEVSHQWWGHQVSPAPIKGAALITESLAWFSAFEIVEQALGQKTFQTFLNLARRDFLSPQERDADPLLQASQTSLIYRKGPLALYALREYIGKEQVRLGLQNFFRKYSTLNTARPVPSDLYRELQMVTPDSMRYLLHDLLASNTFWELKTEKAVASPTSLGKWNVTIDVYARKYTVDKKGTQTDVAMNDLVQIGVYGVPGDTKTDKNLYMQPHRICSGRQRLEIEVTGKPELAGIDPNNILMDLKNYDHLTKVQLRQNRQ